MNSVGMLGIAGSQARPNNKSVHLCGINEAVSVRYEAVSVRRDPPFPHCLIQDVVGVASAEVRLGEPLHNAGGQTRFVIAWPDRLPGKRRVREPGDGPEANGIHHETPGEE